MISDFKSAVYSFPPNVHVSKYLLSVGVPAEKEALNFSIFQSPHPAN